MLKNELITQEKKNQMLKDNFNKIWYNGLQDIVFNWIKSNLYSDCNTIIPIDPTEIEACFYEYDVQFSLYEIFKLLRSKLWNEGINLLISDNIEAWFVKIRNNEKYNDPFIVSINSDFYEQYITSYIEETPFDLNSFLKSYKKNVVENTESSNKNIKKRKRRKNKKNNDEIKTVSNTYDEKTLNQDAKIFDYANSVKSSASQIRTYNSSKAYSNTVTPSNDEI